MKKPKTSQEAFERYKDRKVSFYFAYPMDRPNTWKLIDTGAYGVVQFCCIDNAVRAAFMAGIRAGSRLKANAGHD